MSWRSNPNPTIKPPFGSYVDWSHPLADGLAECILFNEHSGGTINNLISHKNFTIYQGTPYWDGKGFYLDDHGNNTDNDIINAEFGCIRNNITTTAIELVDSDLGSGRNTFYRGGNKYQYGELNDTGDLNLNLKDPDGHGFYGTISANYQANKVVQVGFIADWKNNLGYGIYNSQKVSLTIAGSGWRTDGIFGTNIQVGYGYDFNNYYGLNGHVYLFCLFLREFSAEELEWILAEPYCFIAWPSHRVIFDYGAGQIQENNAVFFGCNF